MLDPEFAGFLVDNKYIGRPVDVEIMKRWIGAVVGRLERCDLSHHLRQGEGRRPVTRLCGRGFLIPGHFRH
jgi:hypothetical protein